MDSRPREKENKAMGQSYYTSHQTPVNYGNTTARQYRRNNQRRVAAEPGVRAVSFEPASAIGERRYRGHDVFRRSLFQ